LSSGGELGEMRQGVRKKIVQNAVAVQLVRQGETRKECLTTGVSAKTRLMRRGYSVGRKKWGVIRKKQSKSAKGPDQKRTMGRFWLVLWGWWGVWVVWVCWDGEKLTKERKGGSLPKGMGLRIVLHKSKGWKIPRRKSYEKQGGSGAVYNVLLNVGDGRTAPGKTKSGGDWGGGAGRVETKKKIAQNRGVLSGLWVRVRRASGRARRGRRGKKKVRTSAVGTAESRRCEGARKSKPTQEPVGWLWGGTENYIK